MDHSNAPACPNNASPGAAGGTSSEGGEKKHGKPQRKALRAFDRFASRVTKWAGSPFAFTLAFIVVLAWAISGPLFDYSETWQLVINTGTTIITFLMVFLIQQSQNKDSQAVHLKLEELLQAVKEARDEMIDIEDLSEEDLQELAEQFKRKTKS